MWHSTQFTRACAPCLCAAISSGCTLWHITAQNSLLLEYSQPLMPIAPNIATPASTARTVVSVPSTSVRLPSLMFMLACFLERARRMLIVVPGTPAARRSS